MITTGETIFWANARSVLRDIGMRHLNPDHGAVIDTVRWCLLVRGRPTHQRQSLLERRSPALLAYLEKLSTSGDSIAWRTLEERIRLRAEILREAELQPCARPWLAAMWHTLPELAAIGQSLLDRQEERDILGCEVLSAVPASSGEAEGGDGDKGSAGKAGSAGTAAKPQPTPRLIVPAAHVVLTEVEKKTLDLDGVGTGDSADDTPEDPDGPAGPKQGGRL